MCSEGPRVSKALRHIHEVKYLGADPKPLVDRLFRYHNLLMGTHRQVNTVSKTQIEGLYTTVTLCEFCVVPWPCPEINKWLDTIGEDNGNC